MSNGNKLSEFKKKKVSSPAAALSFAAVRTSEDNTNIKANSTVKSPATGTLLPLPLLEAAERRKAWNHRGGKRGRMEAAWACAVDRAADMADSARRFFLSLRRPQQPPPPPPPPPSPNPVSELTPFSLRSLITNASAKA